MFAEKKQKVANNIRLHISTITVGSNLSYNLLRYVCSNDCFQDCLGQVVNPLVNSGKVFCKVSLIPFRFSVLFLKYREKPIVRDRWKSQGEKWRSKNLAHFW